MIFKKKLEFYETFGDSDFSDKIIVPHSMLNDLIEFFRAPKNKDPDSTIAATSPNIEPFAQSVDREIKNPRTPRILSKRRVGAHKRDKGEFFIRDSSEYFLNKNTNDNSGSSSSSSSTDLASGKQSSFDSLIPSPLTLVLKKSPSDSNSSNTVELCVGIKEFSAPEGLVGIPYWIIQHLELNKSDSIDLKYIKLKKGTFAQLLLVEPEKIPTKINIRSILESHLRKNITALIENQPITVRSVNETYTFKVLELFPDNKVDVVDTDLTVDITFLNTDKTIGSNNHNVKNNTDLVDGFHELSLNKKVKSSLNGQPKYFFYKLRSLSSKMAFYKASVECVDSDIDFVSRVGMEYPSLLNFDKFDFSGASNSTKSINFSLSDTSSDYDYVYSFAVIPTSETPCDFFISIQECDQQDIGDNTGTSKDISALNTTSLTKLGLDSFEEVNPDNVICNNCKSEVPKIRFNIHEAICIRNNQACKICGLVLSNADFKDSKHMHCYNCDYYGDLSDLSKHEKYYHSKWECPRCPEDSFESIVEFGAHRNSNCPDRMIICKFCHILVQQGPQSIRMDDVMHGYHEHESYCGSRTVICKICNKNIQLRKIQIHADTHRLAKQSQPLPLKLCLNIQCGMPMAGSIVLSAAIKQFFANSNNSSYLSLNMNKNILGMCTKCFSPFLVHETDKNNANLLKRVVRTLHSQLVYGCKQEFCRNKKCATGNKELKATPTEAAGMILPTISKLTSFLNNHQTDLADSLEINICVDSQTNTHKECLNQMITLQKTQSTKRYLPEWISLALSANKNNIDESFKWLNSYAPSIE
ncbi:Ubiquitin fusion degradation protein 1-like protein [Smittium culicis]|uniref:Ubiquitin fusion degradation protein 1-like protein n=1 Tax=Smittium culicis TaxID=133412 RepID=A0A1R1YGM0_9FUNG|nr:Ubiquitin fusion degradation protein 1-like protein [Smittium culicis]